MNMVLSKYQQYQSWAVHYPTTIMKRLIKISLVIPILVLCSCAFDSDASRLDELEGGLSDLEQKVDNLESENSDLKSQVEDLESEISDLRDRVDDLEYELEDLR